MNDGAQNLRLLWEPFSNIPIELFMDRMYRVPLKKLNTIDEHGNVVQKGEGQCDTSQS